MEDNGVLEEQEIPAVVENAAPEPVEPKEPVSLRETINQARKDVSEKTEPDVKETKQRERQPDGKFAKKQDAAVVPDAHKEVEPPTHINNSYKAHWKDIPPVVRDAIAKREEEVHREITSRSEDRTLGQKFKEVVTPYVAQMRAEGAEPMQAVQSLLNTAYVLRSGSQAQKTQLLLETARQFGVDLRQAAQQPQQQVHPVIQELQHKQALLEQRLEQERVAKEQQEQAGIHGQIATFAAQPGHEHFETVKAHMAALLSNNLAKDLQDAYDQAIYARPDIRSTILNQQSAGLEAKRVAEIKAKADAAKRAGSSLRGSPGMVAEKNGKIAHSNLRDAIASSYRQVVEG